MSDLSSPRPATLGRRVLQWWEERVNLTEIFSFVTHFGLVYTPVDTTKPLSEVTDDLATRRIASYASGPRLLGVLAVVLFAVEAITGLLLAFYYRPTPDAAFQSTRMIVRDVPLGWFVHQMHAWGAYGLIALVSIRLVRLLWDGLYRAPREVLWMAGVAMAWLAVQSDLTGRLLTWDTQSYWGGVRAMEVLYALPVVGNLLAYFVGGKVVNEDVLLRFYVLHITVLPLLFTLMVYATFATVRRIGLAEPHHTAPDKTITYRDHFFSLSFMALLIFAVLVTLAALVPFPFRGAADPFATPTGASPPWYFWAPYALLQKAPGPLAVRGGLWLFAIVAAFTLPFWARADKDGSAGRGRVLGLLAVAVWLALGCAGYFLERR